MGRVANTQRIHSHNEGNFEVVASQSPVHRVRWYVSVRNGQYQWWHSPSLYTKTEAVAIMRFLATLSDATLEKVLLDKLLEAGKI